MTRAMKSAHSKAKQEENYYVTEKLLSASKDNRAFKDLKKTSKVRGRQKIVQKSYKIAIKLTLKKVIKFSRCKGERMRKKSRIEDNFSTEQEEEKF
jgi:hypothetical protein